MSEERKLIINQMITAFPKIFALGNKQVLDIFKSDVEITEKIDGSMFVFGSINGGLQMRSKGKIIFMESCEKMFNEAVAYVVNLFSKNVLPENMLFNAEYLQKPKHNVLLYDQIPLNNLALFGVKDLLNDRFMPYDHIEDFARLLEIDAVPRLFQGKVEDQDMLMQFLEKTSYLGGQKIEGIVIKNYNNQFLVGDQYFHLMAAKFVSEKYKEVHNKNWKDNTGKGKFELFKDKYRSEARWDKAIIHLREQGEIEDDPRDIGRLMKEIEKDIAEECKDEIMQWLWLNNKREILRHATKGFPEWYKKELMKKAFDNIKEFNIRTTI